MKTQASRRLGKRKSEGARVNLIAQKKGDGRSQKRKVGKGWKTGSLRGAKRCSACNKKRNKRPMGTKLGQKNIEDVPNAPPTVGGHTIL